MLAVCNHWAYKSWQDKYLLSINWLNAAYFKKHRWRNTILGAGLLNIFWLIMACWLAGRKNAVEYYISYSIISCVECIIRTCSFSAKEQTMAQISYWNGLDRLSLTLSVLWTLSQEPPGLSFHLRAPIAWWAWCRTWRALHLAYLSESPGCWCRQFFV